MAYNFPWFGSVPNLMFAVSLLFCTPKSCRWRRWTVNGKANVKVNYLLVNLMIFIGFYCFYCVMFLALFLGLP